MIFLFLYFANANELENTLEKKELQKEKNDAKFEELIRQILSVKRLEWQEHPENMDKLVSETLEDFKAAYTQ